MCGFIGECVERRQADGGYDAVEAVFAFLSKVVVTYGYIWKSGKNQSQ